VEKRLVVALAGPTGVSFLVIGGLAAEVRGVVWSTRPLGMTQVALAEKMGVPLQRVNTLVNGKRGVTAETAILLADVLGTTPEFWMNLQVSLDLWTARRAMKRTG